MEITKAQIAGLVLGYLKSEKCTAAFNEFLNTSNYFKESKHRIKMGKYFVTRVGGMSLIDFLEEYATIYSIVQGRLEASNFFNESRTKSTLIEQLLYLLEGTPTNHNSTPIPSSSEVDTTPAHALPGNNSDDSESSLSKTPKRRCSRGRSSPDVSEPREVSEVFAQTLLESHELHEKLAETINIVRNTPEMSKTEENIIAGASKELDAIIKTVVQRTEEDPVYNKLIDEIIGTASFDDNAKKNEDSNRVKKKCEKSANSSIEDITNDAVRSIIAASQNTQPPTTSTPLQKPDNTSEVYVFDGTLDTYLKSTTVCSNVATAPQNPLLISTGGLIVMPQTSGYIVNSQPMISVKNVLNENDIMAMPTIIVNDEVNQFTAQTYTIAPQVKNSTKKRPALVPKPKTTKPTTIKPSSICTVVTASQTATSSVVTTKAPSQRAVRNLNFSTPNSMEEVVKLDTGEKREKLWDADLRALVNVAEVAKAVTPKRKRPKKKGKAKQVDGEEKMDGIVEEAKVMAEMTTPPDCVSKELTTPIKDIIPKTPGVGIAINNYDNCTPFNDLLEQQLQGVDLMSLPTPKMPITPGFSLTPLQESIIYHNRNTDYSTSSSYYQPSDTEQNKSIEDLIQECKKDEAAASSVKTNNLRILSDVVIQQSEIETSHLTNNEERTNCKEHLKKFNHSVIGKKNLSLLKNNSILSTSSDSDTSENRDSNVTVIKNETVNHSILSDTVPVKDERADLLTRLETVRQRTVKKLQNEIGKPKQPIRKRIQAKPRLVKRNSKKDCDTKTDEMLDELRERGIHLMPAKGAVEAEEKVVKPPRRKYTRKTAKEKTMEPPRRNPVRGKKAVVEDVKCVEKTEKCENETLVPLTRQVFDQSIDVVHCEGSCVGKKYDLEILQKTFEFHLFDDELGCEVTGSLCCVPYQELLSRDNGDDLMDFVFTGGSTEENPDLKQSPTRRRKRKSPLSEDNKPVEKKRKSHENSLKILKKIDVEEFLDQVHPE